MYFCQGLIQTILVHLAFSVGARRTKVRRHDRLDAFSKLLLALCGKVSTHDTLSSRPSVSMSGLPPKGAPAYLSELPVGVVRTGYRSSGHSFSLRRLSYKPHIFAIQNFLSTEECDEIVDRAKMNGFEIAETTGQTQSRRNCEVSFLSPHDEPLLASIQRDAAMLCLSDEALNSPHGGCENLNVLQYRIGGAYSLHYDGLTHPRFLTILYYLNGVGATWFPLADATNKFSKHVDALSHAESLDAAFDGLRFEPASVGDALIFYNFDSNGEPEPLTLHAGLETNETKWIGTHFFSDPSLLGAN